MTDRDTDSQVLARISALVIQRDALDAAIDQAVLDARNRQVTFEAIGQALGGTGKPQTKQTAAARYERVKARQTTRRGRR